MTPFQQYIVFITTALGVLFGILFERFVRQYEKYCESMIGQDMSKVNLSPTKGLLTSDVLEPGLYHVAEDDIKDSVKRRREVTHRETFDPTEGWDDDIFDYVEAGRYGG
jgi:hypothetical protein